MVSESIVTIIQFVIMFALVLVISMLALDRKTIVSNVLASVLWVVFAIMNFMIGYTLFGSMVSYIFGAVGFIFAGNFVISVISSYADTKHARYEF